MTVPVGTHVAVHRARFDEPMVITSVGWTFD